MCQVTPNELLSYANDFLIKNYGMELNVPLKINGRLKKTYGCFRYLTNRMTGESKELSVELNKTFVIHNSKEDVFNVLRHELIHYACFKMNKPHSDGERYFENELKKHNTYSQTDVNRMEVKMKSRYRKFYTYECNCGINNTTTNITRGLYSCRVCKKRLVTIQIERKLV